MLQALCSELSRDRGLQDALRTRRDTPSVVLTRAWQLLQGSAAFALGVQQATSTDVEGCSKDAPAALREKERANALFRSGEPHQAVQQYTEALRLQPGDDPAAVAALHCNRAQACVSAAARQQQQQPKQHEEGKGQAAAGDQAAAAMETLLKAAEADASETLSVIEAAPREASSKLAALAVKALFRRATARRLLHKWAAAISDCDAALRRLATGGKDDPQTAAEIRALRAATEQERAQQQQQQQERQQQQQPDLMQAPDGPSDHQRQLDAEAAAEQQPPNGPSLSVLDALLAASYAQLPAAATTTSSPTTTICPLRASYSAATGRLLTAATRIPAATDVLIELPFTAVPTKAARHSVCWRCFAPLGLAPAHCGGCAMAAYCSGRCRAADAAVHCGSEAGGGAAGLVECGRPWPVLVPVEGWLAARMVVLQQQQQQQQQQGRGGDDVAKAAASASLVDSLPEQRFSGGAADPVAVGGGEDDMLHQVVIACLIGGVSQQQQQPHLTSTTTSSSSSTGMTPPVAVAAAAFQALRRVVVCGVALRPNQSAGAADWLGLGLYPLTAAVVNHSCDPNCSVRFVVLRVGDVCAGLLVGMILEACELLRASHSPAVYFQYPLLIHPPKPNPNRQPPRLQGSRLVMRVTRPVSSGDQLTISYGPQVGAAPAADRKRQLLQQYGFECGCSACGAPDLAAEAAAVGLKCPNAGCRGALLAPSSWINEPSLLSDLLLILPPPSPSSSTTRHPSIPSPLLTSPPGRCVTCNAQLSPQQEAAALSDLRQAAVEEEEVMQILVGDARSQNRVVKPGQTQKQQQQPPYAGRERTIRRLLMARDLRAAHMHAMNQMLGCSNSKLAEVAAEAAGVVPAARAAAVGLTRVGAAAPVQRLGTDEWQQLGEQAAAAARKVSSSDSDLLQWAAEAAGKAAGVVELHYGVTSPAAGYERLRHGWLQLVLGCRKGQQGGAPGAAADVESGLRSIEAACRVLRCHFG